MIGKKSSKRIFVQRIKPGKRGFLGEKSSQEDTKKPHDKYGSKNDKLGKK
jgi:hypothetical protein